MKTFVFSNRSNYTAIVIAVAITVFFSTLNAQQVDPFTGGFSTGMNLMQVPSPDGMSIPVTASYSGGIMVNQASSEIGLGWDLGAGGFITRSVLGLPDDWKAKYTMCAKRKGLVNHYGSFYFNSATIGSAGATDIYMSVDSPSYAMPNYDKYSISAPNLGGLIVPRLFDYSTITDSSGFIYANYKSQTTSPGGTDEAKYFSTYIGASKKPQFNFAGDFADTLISRHFQTTPFLTGTSLNFPNSSVTYNSVSSTDAYTGAKGTGTYDGYTKTNGRLWGTKYIEYFTNAEINTGVSGFINFESGHSRTTGYDADGIGGFRVVNEGGYVYHFSLPVYVNYTWQGSFPLKNDWSLFSSYNVSTIIGSNDTLRRLTDFANYVSEYRQSKPYAYQWMLTAITGPDYVDANNNGMADAGDKGYWAAFDYKKWTDNFTQRFPKYGLDYSYNAAEKDSLMFSTVDAAGKISGKFGTYSITNSQVFYLNKITTSTNTAVFVRDIRNDETGDNRLTTTNPGVTTLNLPVTGNNSTSATVGTLYDDGGASGNYAINASGYTTINAPVGGHVTINFKSFNVGGFMDGDVLKIFDGAANYPSNPLYTFTYSGVSSLPVLNQNYISTSTAFIIQLVSNSSGSQSGFQMGWNTVAQTDKYIPQLKVSKIVLFSNNDWSSVPAPSAMPNNTAWNLAATQYNAATIYDGNWYTTNQSTIESKSLQTIEFDQDYSLARMYHRNINTQTGGTYHMDIPGNVQSNISTSTYASSGKLTLNKIHLYKYLHTKVDPPTLYDYNYSISTKNPDYNPMQVDYWGLYKSDATARAFSGYVTSTSKDYVDAWSLRTITKPEGGTVNITYESNTYDRVLGGGIYYYEDVGGSNGYQGPTRTYGIKTISCPGGGTNGVDFGFTLEDNTSDFWTYAAINNTTSNSNRHVLIPYSTSLGAHISTGRCTISSGTNTINSVEIIQSYTPATFDYTAPSYNGATFGPSSCGSSYTLSYTGKGYVSFNLGVGTTVYGAGVRVQSIAVNNGSTDSYIQKYTYSPGVATTEPDRFAIPRVFEATTGSTWYLKLRASLDDQFQLAPMVGYPHVTVQNMGQSAVNAANGSTDYYFLTDDNGYNNYKKNIVEKTVSALTGFCNYVTTNDQPSHVCEIIDDFSSAWGMPTETRVSDKNGNLISRTVNTISTLKQGSLVENFQLVKTAAYYVGSCLQDFIKTSVFIFRQYPAMVTSTTEYNKDVQNTTTNLKFDEITFEPVLTKSTGPNSSEIVTRSTPAFRISQYANMGPKSKTSTNYNQTNSSAETRTKVDSAGITGNSNFSSFSVNPWNNTYTVREFDRGGTNTWKITANKTLPIYFSPNSYAWVGPLSSFGLYDHTYLPSPVFNYTTPPGSSYWRISEKTSVLDYKGHVIEKVGINNRFTAYKYCDKDRILGAQAGNVNYASFTFTGFEDTLMVNGSSAPVFFSGEVDQQSGVWTDFTTKTPHTGNYTVKLPSNNTYGPMWTAKYTSGMTTADSLQRARTYRASVWVHKDSPNTVQLIGTLDGSVGNTSVSMSRNDANAILIGDWLQLNVEIVVPGNYISSGGPLGVNNLRFYLFNPSGSGGDAWFDDFAVHPVDAPFSAKIYDTRTKWLTAEIDNNNFATKYVYDNGGRLSQVWKEIQGVGLKKVKSYTYNTARALN